MPPETNYLSEITLAALVSVQRRFLRSVNLERDFYSPDPLDGYLLTASAAAAFERLSAGIAQPHARAFSLTGPYGSGKSAFALFASKVMAPARCYKEQRLKSPLSGEDAACPPSWTKKPLTSVMNMV